MAARKTETIEIEGRKITISNADKVLFPAAGFTKAHVIDYYARVSGWLLPHLRDHPVTLKRYPDGVRGEHFYEKDAPGYTPDWVRTFPVPRRSGDADINYIIISNLPTLVWCANLANLEIHPFLHRVPKIDSPTSIVFDLDPGEGMGVLDCARMAFLVRETLERLDLRCFPKVSGSKGLQIYVPLNTGVRYDVTQPFARTLANLLENEHPDLVVSAMAKAARKGKVFIDWSQNSDFKTTVGVYSLRAKRSHPYVSMPVTWEELRDAEKKGDEGALYFGPDAALKRLAETGDIFAEVLTLKQRLPARVLQSLEAGVRAAKPDPKALDAYRAKRDFAKTPEPAPAVPRRSRQGGRRRFARKKADVSALTGRTMDQIAAEKTATWQSNRARPEQIPEVEDLPDSDLKFVDPMRAKLTGAVPEGAEWQYEIKFDGYRALAVKNRGEATLYSRNRNVLNGRFPEVARAVETLEDGSMIDGEIVALDSEGRPSFNVLQNYQPGRQPIFYYVFDVLAYRGKSLLHLPLAKRREVLEKYALAGMADPVRLSEVLRATGAEVAAAARQQGLEGIVAKRAASIYEPGERSGAWLKYKTNQGQELVIGGYMPGPHGFTSLLVGYYEGRKLMFIGKVKNGFTPRLREEVFRRFEGLETNACPFANLPEPRNARRGEALTAEVMKKCRWLKPKLVAQVEFTDWTAANHLRHPRFAGLRDDKNPREIKHEAA